MSAAQKKDDDPVATSTDAAPDHYRGECENNHVRVNRVHYGAGETSDMQSHELFAGVALTGTHSVVASLEGISETRAKSFPAGLIDGDLPTHSVRSISNCDREGIVVEIRRLDPAVTAVIPNICDVRPSMAKRGT